MALPKQDSLISTVATVLREKEALASRERDLVKSLNKMLKKMGYEVVKIEQRTTAAKSLKTRKRRRRKNSVGSRPLGRPPKNSSEKKSAINKIKSKPSK